MHYKKMYDDAEWLYEYDLDGREVTVTIERVFPGEVVGTNGKKTKKPALTFQGTAKKFAVNKTNGRTIATLYGTDTTKWPGQRITLKPAVTAFGGETVPCIRVVPGVPKAKETK